MITNAQMEILNICLCVKIILNTQKNGFLQLLSPGIVYIVKLIASF